MPRDREYRPIACAVHDVLEASVVRRIPCTVRFTHADGRALEVVSRLVDVYARDGAEYVRLEAGPEVRLDRLDSVEPVA